uniref:Uncharacterized protein n=1 Tax=Rhizobium rhizogenes TaxID=359 RepID=A0A4P8DK78_RHIRH|nr:hypothetical protein pTiC5.7_44 [Rhizobium rhizogenes]QCL10889.1 hypothetical protein pTiC6.5_44 [Rhizobium rhizogenes]
MTFWHFREIDASPKELVKIQFNDRHSEKQFERSNSSQHLRLQREQILSYQLDGYIRMVIHLSHSALR